MKKTIAIAALCLFCSSDVIADGIINPGIQFIGNMGEGISNSTPGGPPPVNPCTGAADFSDGCAIAVFGH